MPRDKPEAPENYPYSRENLPDKSYVAVLTMQEGTTYGWPTHEWPSLRQLAALLDIDIKLASSRPGSMTKKDWVISKIVELRNYKVAREHFPSLEVGESMESAVGASTDPTQTQPRKSPRFAGQQPYDPEKNLHYANTVYQRIVKAFKKDELYLPVDNKDRALSLIVDLFGCEDVLVDNTTTTDGEGSSSSATTSSAKLIDLDALEKTVLGCYQATRHTKQGCEFTLLIHVMNYPHQLVVTAINRMVQFVFVFRCNSVNVCLCFHH